jgi:hypothetical protein
MVCIREVYTGTSNLGQFMKAKTQKPDFLTGCTNSMRLTGTTKFVNLGRTMKSEF